VDSEWFKLEQKSRERVKKILRINPLEVESLEIYDIGNIRTLEEYQNFCGVNFQTQEISETASKGIPTKSLLLS
jgi:hypothetical protein